VFIVFYFMDSTVWFIVINCAIWSTDHKVVLNLSWVELSWVFVVRAVQQNPQQMEFGLNARPSQQLLISYEMTSSVNYCDAMLQRLRATGACTASRRRPTVTCSRRSWSPSAAPWRTWRSSSVWRSTAASDWWGPRTCARWTGRASWHRPAPVRLVAVGGRRCCDRPLNFASALSVIVFHCASDLRGWPTVIGAIDMDRIDVALSCRSYFGNPLSFFSGQKSPKFRMAVVTWWLSTAKHCSVSDVK